MQFKILNNDGYSTSENYIRGVSDIRRRAQLSIPSSINFGTVITGSSIDATITLQNVGDLVLSGTLSIASGSGFTINSSSFGLSGSLTMNTKVTFIPSEFRQYISYITASSNSINSPIYVLLSGSADDSQHIGKFYKALVSPATTLGNCTGLNITAANDGTIDFWFSASAQSNQTAGLHHAFINNNNTDPGIIFSFDSHIYNNQIGDYQPRYRTCLMTNWYMVDSYTYGLHIFGANNVSTTDWHHVALVKHGKDVIIFVDGQIDNSYTINGFDDAYGKNYLNFNAASAAIIGSSFDGLIDEFRVSDIARWTGSFAPPTSAYTTDAHTKLLLHFDSNPLIDSSGQGITLTDCTITG